MSAQDWHQTSDAELLEICRQGQTEAFSIVWERHRGAALAAARGVAPTLDADDIVSDAYLKIFELTLQGDGPRGAFRPYLYRVIRSVAVDRLRNPERPSDELDQIPDLHEIGPWEDSAFDLNAVSKAFSTLSERWQAALWYTEVEGMPPREAALLIGISANSVSALALRAREALRSAWVEAHVTEQLAQEACRRTRKDLQRYQRGKLTARASREVEAHLEECDACAAVAAEFSTLNKQLGLVLAAVFLGSVGAAALLKEIGVGLVAPAATSAAASVQEGPGGSAGGTGAAGSSGTAAAAGAGAGIGSVAAIASGIVVAAAAVIGGAVLVVSNLVLPVEVEADEPPASPTEHVNQAQSRDSADDSDETEAPETEADSDATDELTVSSGSTYVPSAPRNPQAPPKPTPPSPTNPPDPPGDGSDPALSIGFDCYLPGSSLVGEASEYGVLRLRATQGAAAPVEILNPLYDPDDTTGTTMFDPGTGLFDDGHGNTFDFGFYTGTDPDPGPYVWFGQDPTLLPSWAPAFGTLTLDDVTVELRLITPDGRYSPWTVIDTSLTC